MAEAGSEWTGWSPERFDWVATSLGLKPSDLVLEIGCGKGAAVRPIVEKLERGRMTAIDRSAKMVRLARERNTDLIQAGRLEVEEVALAHMLPKGRPFDIAFAIHVNVFWLDPRKEILSLEKLLQPGGRLHLFYQPPGEARGAEIAERIAANLNGSAFRRIRTEIGKVGAGNGLHVSAQFTG